MKIKKTKELMLFLLPLIPVVFGACFFKTAFMEGVPAAWNDLMNDLSRIYIKEAWRRYPSLIFGGGEKSKFKPVLLKDGKPMGDNDVKS